MFLEASQGSENRMDLSFSSLIQKPISRISKYKLFLDTLLKLTPVSEDPSSHFQIRECVNKIDEQIREVNRYGMQEKYKCNLLFQNLIFSPKTLKFPVEYLGLPILSASLDCVWVGKDRQVQYQVFGAFLFKTHLILANVSKENKFEVKFLIPLSICKIHEPNAESILGGLYTNYDESFKLIFEYNFTLVEILCLQYDLLEKEVWMNKLDILINHVNGPYKFDYSSSKLNEELGIKCSTILPSNILPFDAKLDHFKSIKLKKKNDNIILNCYFSDIIPLKIETIAISNNENNNFYYHRSKSLRLANKSIDGFHIQLKLIERSRIEYLLQDLWSDELLSVELMNRRLENTSKKLKKQSSSLSIRSFGSRRHHHLHRHHTSQGLIDRQESDTTTTVTTTNRDDEEQSESRDKTTTKRSDSIIRRTSIVFGSAFKSIMSSSDH